MSTKDTEEQQGKLIQKAVEKADTAARNDDVAFVSTFRKMYFEEQSKLTGDKRRTNQKLKQINDSFFSIHDDPRYASNARSLTKLKHDALAMGIIGGTEVRGTSFHDCVAILCGGEGANFMGACTGTLIAKNAVLTAGHCHCRMNASRVFVGNNIEGEGEMVNVARQERHPEYQTATINDLMVIVLESEITNVPTRKIAPSEMIDKATYVRAVGFGNTDPDGSFGYGVKRQVDVPIVSNSCQGRTNGMSDQTAYGCDPGLELVAGKPMLAMDTCTGDSGGPIYVSDGQDRWLLAGATSRGSPNTPNRCGDGGVYVRADRYLDWIRSIADVRLD
jgi:secreted trypsin-like serine protease